MKKVLIIGGGIAGLTAGIYAQRVGFKSTIYEKHYLLGGECTGWDRKGFHIDGCIHWLMGTKNDTGLNKVLRQVGAISDEIAIYQPEYFVKMEYEGSTVFLYRDLDKLKTHLLEVSPEDHKEIEQLCAYIQCFYDFEPPIEKPIDLMSLPELIRFLSTMKETGAIIKKLGKLSVQEYSQRFKHPTIQKALMSIIPEYYSAYILPSSMATFMSGNGGRPKGGSRALAKRMEETYRSLNGEVILGKEVSEIQLGSDCAKGIVLNDGTKIEADYIIPACDVHVTLKKLLQNQFPDKKFETRYKDNEAYPLQSSVYISLGVDFDLSDYPVDLVFQTDNMILEDRDVEMISVKHYSYEPSFSPPEKSIMIVYFTATFDWWKQLSREQYDAKKKQLAEDVKVRIEKRFPELNGKISVLDVATPLTYERYCGAYKGSWMSFGQTPSSKQLMHPGKIKGLKNVYMAGQWLMPPGGLPTALLTGKWAIQRICKQEKIEFK